MMTSSKCPECGKKLSSPNALRAHASKAHAIDAECLYRMLHPICGMCLDCGIQTRFDSFTKGFRDRCPQCAHLNAVRKTAVTRRSNYKPAWNVGKTKETDVSVAKISCAVKENITQRGGHWSAGKTKETDQSIADAAIKRSNTMIESFKSGRRKAWHSGHTKETHASLMKMGETISKSLETAHWSRDEDASRLISDKISASRASLGVLSHDDVIQKLTAAGAFERFEIDTSSYRRYTDHLDVTCHTCHNSMSRTWLQLFEGAMCVTCNPHKVWCEGLTKHTDDRVKRLGLKVSHTLKARNHDKISLWKSRIGNSHRLSKEDVKCRLDARSDEFSYDITVVDEYMGNAKNFDLTCRKCGNMQKMTLVRLDRGSRCHVCFPPQSTSKWQIEIADMIRSSTDERVIDNDRTQIAPYELDIWVPSKRFAVECHGLYWHSDVVCDDTMMHEKKMTMCNDAGISLLQVFEDEWRDKRVIVESMIKHRIGQSTKVHARDCSIDVIPTSDARDFLDSTHLEGYVSARHKLGMFHRGDLVGVATFRRPHHSKWSSYLEIARVAFRLNTQVVGGISKFLHHARRLFSMRLMSYADTRLGGTGAAYAHAGMTYLGRSTPRFWWTDFDVRYDRFEFRADKARGQTQSDIARSAGVHRIWGVSNAVFVDAPSCK